MKRLVVGILLALIGIATIAAQFTDSGPYRLANAVFAVIVELVPGALLIGFGVRAIKHSRKRRAAPDLKVSDFPNVQPNAFHRWKDAILEPVNANHTAAEKAIILTPAIVGGVIMGLPSATEFIYLFAPGNRGICGSICCLSVPVGGAVAAIMLRRRITNREPETRDGVLAGFYAAIAGSLLVLVIGVPMGLLEDKLIYEQRQDIWERGINEGYLDPGRAEREFGYTSGTWFSAKTLLTFVVTYIVSTIVCIALSSIGGLIGIKLSGKRRGPPISPAVPTAQPV